MATKKKTTAEPKSEIKRYNPPLTSPDCMHPNDAGEYVRYEDHAAEVERLSTDGLHHVALILAAHNALPDLLAELHTLRARVAELERDLDACRVELLEAQHTVGEGWFAGGATLAEAIERKCRALESDSAKAAAELERLRRDNEMACENTPWPGCECQGCGTARERAEAELNGGDR